MLTVVGDYLADFLSAHVGSTADLFNFKVKLLPLIVYWS